MELELHIKGDITEIQDAISKLSGATVFAALEYQNIPIPTTSDFHTENPDLKICKKCDRTFEYHGRYKKYCPECQKGMNKIYQDRHYEKKKSQ